MTKKGEQQKNKISVNLMTMVIWIALIIFVIWAVSEMVDTLQKFDSFVIP